MNYDRQEIKFILFDLDQNIVMKAISEIKKTHPYSKQDLLILELYFKYQAIV